jgi:hypothetical protein
MERHRDRSSRARRGRRAHSRAIPKIRRAVAAACAAAPLLCATLNSPPAQGATVVSTWNGATSLWSSTNWANVPASGGYPNNGNLTIPTYDAVVNSGQVTLDLNVTIQKLTLAGGTLNVANTLVANELFTWNGGTLSGTGTLTARGGILIGANTHFFTQRTLNNPATTNWTGGAINAGAGAAFINPGTFNTNFSGNWFFNQGGSAPTFENTGLFHKTAGTGQTFLGARLNNSGTVSADAGTILIGGGGQASGQFAAGAGAAIEFSSDYTLNPGTSFSGAGTARVSGSTLTLAGNVNATNFELTGGTFTGGGAFAANNFNWTGGIMTGTGVTSFAPGASLSLAGTTKVFTQRTISNSGTANWSAGAISGGLGATFNNSGTFLVGNTTSWSYNQGGNAPVFNNSGTVTKTTGAGVVTLGIVFNNLGPAGVVNVNAGTLTLSGGGSASGMFVLAPNTVLSFTNDYSLENGASFSGNGTARVSGGTLGVNGTVTAARFEVAAGTLGGGGTLTIGERLEWGGGTMSGTGSTLVSPGATALLDTTTKVLVSRRFVNSGSLEWLAGGVNSGLGAVFQNDGTMTVNANAGFLQNQGGALSQFINNGTINKSANTTTFNVGFNNAGNINLTGGTLALDGAGTHSGSFVVGPGATLSFGGGAQDLAGAASITGGGTVLFDGGTVDVDTGAYNVSGITRVTGGAANFNTPSATTNSLIVTGGAVGGGGTITATSTFTWSGGSMSGTGSTVIAPAATGLLDTTTKVHNGRRIVNLGSVDWSAGGINAGGGGVFQNVGTFTTSTGAAYLFNQGGAAPSFNNLGQFTKTAGTVATTMGITFNNSGTVLAGTGTIIFSGGGSASGNFVAAPNAVINFSNDYTLASGVVLGGAGEHRLTAGTLTLQGDIDAAHFVQSAGTLTGPGNLTLSSAMDWTGGIAAGAGSIRVPASATLNLQGTTKVLNRSVSNSGTANWSAGNFNSGQGSVFNNTGTFLNTFGGGYSFNQGGAAPVFNNSGLFQKSGPGDPTNLFVSFNNTGTVRVDAGTLLLSAQGTSTGRFEIAAAATLDIGSGGLQVLGPGAALIGPGAARILSGGTLDAAGPAVTADRLEQAGTLQGGGTLLVNQSYSWTAGLMTGPGTTSIAPAATATWAGGIKTMNGGRVFSNAGSLSWDAGGVNAGQGVVLGNSGTFTINSPLNVAFAQNQGGTQATFNNSGRLIKAGGTSTAEIAAAFIGSGTTQVNIGVLNLSGGGTSGGRFEIAPGAELRLSSTTFNFNSSSTITGGGTFRANAGVTSVGGDFDVATTSIDGATLNLSAGASPNSRTLVTHDLLFNALGSRLNLNNNSAVIDYSTTSPLPVIKAKLLSGYAGGQWNGNGILSTSAAQQSNTAIGYGEASAVLGIGGTQTASFNSRNVDATSLLLKYTLSGDTNLSGKVDFVDLVALAQNYNILDGSRLWTQGDFDYNGNVDFADLVKLAQNYNAALPGAAIPGAPASFDDDLARAFAQVPEPSGFLIGLLACGFAGPMRRRRAPRA